MQGTLILSAVCTLSHVSHVRLFVTLWLLCPWDSPGKNTGVGCHALHWGIFLNQRLNLSLYVSCIGRRVLYHKRHVGWCFSPNTSPNV